MKVNYDIIKKFGKKAGFDKLMEEPQFLRMLTNYTDMVIKQDNSVDEDLVNFEIKCIVDSQIMKHNYSVSMRGIIKTMPEDLLEYYYGSHAVEFFKDKKIIC